MNGEERLDKLTEEVMQELLEEFNVPPRQPGDIVRTEFADRAGTTYPTARKFLDDKVRVGAMTKHKVRDDRTGRETIIYRKVPDLDHSEIT